MGDTIQDLRYGLRLLGKSPGFTLVALITLALGVGATSAVFSIMKAVLLNPYAIDDPDGVVMVWDNNVARGHGEVEISYPNFVDWREQNRVFTEMAALPSVNFDVTITGGDEPHQVEATFVSVNFFSLLGARPALGRTLAPQDDVKGAPAIVISDSLWQRQFGARADIIGTRLTIDGEAVTVVGVMPPEFAFPKGAEIWAPLAHNAEEWMKNRSFRVLRAVARLKPGIGLAQARADMESVAANLAKQYPEANNGFGVILVPLVDTIFGNARPALYALFAAVLLVLLIACVNVANLLLARGAARQKEIAVRLALGAGRLRIVRQLLTESLILSVLGGLLGLYCAFVGLDYLVKLAPQDIPRINEVQIDWPVILFSLTLCVITALLFGLAPALQSSQPALTEWLKESSGRATGGARTRRLRAFFVVCEIALAVVVMIGAGLLVRSFRAQQQLDAGYNAKNVLTFRVALPQAKYTNSEARTAFYEKLLARLETLPGVQSAGAVLMRPLSGTVGWDYPFTIEGQSPEAQAANPYSNYQAISPNYFRTMGITMVKGRDFTAQDRKDANIVIVSETLASRYWPGEDAIGKRLKFGDTKSPRPWLTVVGLVKDARYREWGAVRPDIYFPYLQRSEHRMDFVLRTSVDPLSLAGAVRREVYAIDKDQAVTAVTTMSALVDEVLARPRFNALLFTIFALLALVLAAIGVYGVMAYAVAQRTGEIGVRMALGAQARDILRLIVGQGLRLAIMGVLIGVVSALALSRLVTSLLFGIAPTDPVTYLVIAAVTALVAVLACLLPALRATRVDPIVALRCE